mgnify:CR=1 FL=1
MFIDTHCHLSSEFYSDIPEVILEDEKAGMSQIIASFCEIDTVNDVCTFVDNYNIVGNNAHLRYRYVLFKNQFGVYQRRLGVA